MERHFLSQGYILALVSSACFLLAISSLNYGRDEIVLKSQVSSDLILRAAHDLEIAG